jgi:two-component system chemotaxis response regulator CheB
LTSYSTSWHLYSDQYAHACECGILSVPKKERPRQYGLRPAPPFYSSFGDTTTRGTKMKIVVMGGSAGAIKAIKSILPMLPQDFPAAILIVTHIGARKSIMPDILARYSALPVYHATDGEPIIPGRVLVAPPDEHLTVVAKDGKAYVRLIHGPRENHCRPAIDPLFRSAASAFRENTIGIVLSGYLDDGTVGLQAVKACGGLAIVQDPVEADALDMPASALEHVNVDRVLRASDIATVLMELVHAGAQRSERSERGLVASGGDVPNWVNIENRIVGRDSDMDDLEQLGRPSSLTCPECNGALWEISQTGPLRYRCHTGHAFSAKVLETLQRDAVEEAIWAAMRALHEQERLFSRLRDTELQLGHIERANDYELKAKQAKAHSQTLREVIAARTLMVNK